MVGGGGRGDRSEGEGGGGRAGQWGRREHACSMCVERKVKEVCVGRQVFRGTSESFPLHSICEKRAGVCVLGQASV